MSDNNQPKQNRSIGALWEKVARGSGRHYFGGKVIIEGQYYPIVVFKNTKKSKPEQPDYSILLEQKPPAEPPYQYASDREPEELET